MYVLLEAYPA
jgi:hypothetical protein